jgi:hypothetical protein
MYAVFMFVICEYALQSSLILIELPPNIINNDSTAAKYE